MTRAIVALLAVVAIPAGVVLPIAAAGPAAAASPAPTAAPASTTRVAPVPQLSAADRATLEQLVCLGPHRLPLDAIEMHVLRSGGKHPVTVDEADVRCRSHGEVAGMPLRYVQQCDFTRQRWSCSPAYEEFALTINGRQVLMSSAELPPAEVLALAKAVGRAAVIAPPPVPAASAAAPGGDAAPDAPEHCRVTRRAGADPDLYKLSCDVWELLIVRHCDGDACSYRAIERGAPLFQ